MAVTAATERPRLLEPHHVAYYLRREYGPRLYRCTKVDDYTVRVEMTPAHRRDRLPSDHTAIMSVVGAHLRTLRYQVREDHREVYQGGQYLATLLVTGPR